MTLYEHRIYLVCSLVPKEPFVIPMAFSTLGQAEFFLTYNKLPKKQFDIQDGATCLKYKLVVDKNLWDYFGKIECHNLGRKHTWVYPLTCKTPKQRQNYRTNHRRMIRKIIPQLWVGYGTNGRNYFFVPNKNRNMDVHKRTHRLKYTRGTSGIVTESPTPENMISSTPIEFKDNRELLLKTQTIGEDNRASRLLADQLGLNEGEIELTFIVENSNI